MQTFIPRPQDPTLPNAPGEGWGSHLEQASTGSVVRQGKKAIHKFSRVESVFSGPSSFKVQCQKPNGVGCNGQLNSGSLHQQTRRNPLGGDVHSPVEDHDLYHHYQITLKPDTFSECLNVMADLLSRSTPFNQQNGHCIDRFSTNMFKLFTPHVDLFATRLNHKLPLYVSPVPDQNAWDIHALNITGWVSLLMLTLLRLSFTR